MKHSQAAGPGAENSNWIHSGPGSREVEWAGVAPGWHPATLLGPAALLSVLPGWCPSCEGCLMFWALHPTVPEGKRTSVFIFIITELLKPLIKIINKHLLSECPQGILPEKGPSNFTYYKSVQRKWNHSTEHSSSQRIPSQETESRNVWFLCF